MSRGVSCVPPSMSDLAYSCPVSCFPLSHDFKIDYTVGMSTS